MKRFISCIATINPENCAKLSFRAFTFFAFLAGIYGTCNSWVNNNLFLVICGIAIALGQVLSHKGLIDEKLELIITAWVINGGLIVFAAELNRFGFETTTDGNYFWVELGAPYYEAAKANLYWLGLPMAVAFFVYFVALVVGCICSILDAILKR